MELAGMLFTLASQVLGSLVKAKIEAGKKKILEEEVRRAVSSELAKLRHDIQVNVDVVEVLVGEVYSLAGSTPSARVHGREIIVSRRNRLMALSPIRERQLTNKVQRLRARVSGVINEELDIDGRTSSSADFVPEVSIIGQSGEESLSGQSQPLMFPPVEADILPKKPAASVEGLVSSYKKRLASVIQSEDTEDVAE
jgi:hypothetical protein